MEEQNDIKKLLQLIITQNDEIKADISQIKTDFSTQCNKIEIINSKVEYLEKENEDLKKRLLIAERKAKRNNIIIFGVKEEITDILLFVLNLIQGTLQIQLSGEDINNIYRIGQKSVGKPRPIILELISNLKKQKVFHVVNKLKGTGITFANDYIPEDKEEQTVLYQHLKAAKQKQYNAKIVKNRLVVNGDSYTYQNLKNSSNNPPEQSAEKLKNNSAPATPVSSNKIPKENLQTNSQYENRQLEIESSLNKEILQKTYTEQKFSTPSQSAAGSKYKKNNLSDGKDHDLRSKKLKINTN